MMRFLYLILLIAYTVSTQAKEYNITDYGAVGDDKTDNTEAIQKAVDLASENHGTVYFPEGTFLSGTVILKSNITIYLSQGSVWKGYPDLEKYPEIRIDYRSHCDNYPERYMVLANKVDNITITGNGTFYPNGDHEAFQDHIDNSKNRPYGMRFYACNNVEVSNITLIKSAFWMQHYLACNHVRLTNLTVFNHGNLNNDGMDIDGSHDVIISNCFIDASDDAICLKANGERGTENVTITNCVLSSHAYGFKLGTESTGGFRNVTFSNCVIRPSKVTYIPYADKPWNGLCGIGLEMVDGGLMENINIDNVIIEKINVPIFVRLGNRNRTDWEGAKTPGDGIMRNIFISNIVAHQTGDIANSITAYPGNFIENLNLTNIDISTYGGGLNYKDTSLVVPENAGRYPEVDMYDCHLPAHGLYLRHIKNLRMENVNLRIHEKDMRSALILDDVHNADIKGIKGDILNEELPFVQFVNSTDIEYLPDYTFSDIRDLAIVRGDNSQLIRIKGNVYNTENVKPPVSIRASADVKHRTFVKIDWEKSLDDAIGLNQYLLKRNGEEIALSRKTSFIDYDIKENVKYTYSIYAINGYGYLSEPVVVDIKTKSDNEPVHIESVRVVDNQTIEIIFSEPLESETSMNKNIYAIDKGITVKSVQMVNDQSVILRTSSLNRDEQYILSVMDIKDRSLKGNSVDLTINFIDNPILFYQSFDDIPSGTKLEMVDGKHNKGMYFSGNNSQFSIKDSDNMDVSGDFTVALWLKVDNPEADKYYRIVSKRKKWNEPSGYELEINPALERLNICGGNTDANTQGVISNQYTDKWMHIASFVRNDTAFLYVNGELKGMDTRTAGAEPNEYDLHIGSTANGDSEFEGVMDELFIIRRAISEEEVRRLMQGGF